MRPLGLLEELDLQKSPDGLITVTSQILGSSDHVILILEGCGLECEQVPCVLKSVDFISISCFYVFLVFLQ